MNNFIYTIAISYVPLHEKAVETAKEVGLVEIKKGKKKVRCLMCQKKFKRI